MDETKLPELHNGFLNTYMYLTACHATKASKDALRVFLAAMQAGLEAGRGCTPQPMVVVQHQNMADDNSPIAKVYAPIMDGVCGFATVYVKANDDPTRKFIKGLKAASGKFCVPDFSEANRRPDGYQLEGKRVNFSMWVSAFNQSLTRKQEFAKAFCKVLTSQGINAWYESRMD